MAGQLGAEEIFKQVAVRLCLESEVDSEGKILDSEGNRLEDNEFFITPSKEYIPGKYTTSATILDLQWVGRVGYFCF